MKKIIAFFVCLFVMVCSLGVMKTAKAGVNSSTNGRLTYSLTATGKTRSQGVELYYINSKATLQSYYGTTPGINSIYICVSIHYNNGGDSVSSTTITNSRNADWDSGSVLKSSLTASTEKGTSQFRIESTSNGTILKTLSVG